MPLSDDPAPLRPTPPNANADAPRASAGADAPRTDPGGDRTEPDAADTGPEAPNAEPDATGAAPGEDRAEPGPPRVAADAAQAPDPDAPDPDAIDPDAYADEVADAPAPLPTAQTSRAVATPVGPRPEPRYEKPPSGLPLVVRAAAGLLVVGVIAAAVWLAPRPDLEPPFSEAVPPGEQLAAFELPDASEVLLRPGSSLRSASARGVQTVPPERPTERHYVLRGEARFTALPDEANPLVVDAGPVRVTTSNARFVVAASDTTATVYVESGSVEVRADSLRSAPVVDASDEQPVLQNETDTAQVRAAPVASGVRTLPAGQQATLRGGALGLPRAAAPEAALDWTRGVLVAEALPLAQATEELSRHFGTAVRVPPNLRGVRLTGTFELTTLAATLRAVGEAAGGTFVRGGNAYVFTRQPRG